jgi:hypothetical protein
MDDWRKCFGVGVAAVILFSGIGLFCGCVAKSKAEARAHEAYLAGQNDALRQQQAESQPLGITVVGPVQNSDVPWVEGLTLTQAIATAKYLGQHDPKEIVITRRGESAKVAPKMLLTGRDVPLEPGDVVTIRE